MDSIYGLSLSRGFEPLMMLIFGITLIRIRLLPLKIQSVYELRT